MVFVTFIMFNGINISNVWICTSISNVRICSIITTSIKRQVSYRSLQLSSSRIKSCPTIQPVVYGHGRIGRKVCDVLREVGRHAGGRDHAVFGDREVTGIGQTTVCGDDDKFVGRRSSSCLIPDVDLFVWIGYIISSSGKSCTKRWEVYFFNARNSVVYHHADGKVPCLQSRIEKRGSYLVLIIRTSSLLDRTRNRRIVGRNFCSSRSSVSRGI